MEIFIAGSVKPHIPKNYLEEAKKLGIYLSNNNHNIVCTPNKSGIINTVCNQIKKDSSSKVSFVIPKVYLNELNNIDEIDKITNTINERTDYFLQKSDVSLFLPGGFGTIYELFTAIETKKGKEHFSEIIIVNSFGFFDNILEMFKKLYSENFAIEENKNLYFIANTIEDAIEYIKKIQENR